VVIEESRLDQKRPTIDHIPGLDGLRGVAVIAVLLFHAGHLEGGFLGVDLFFVLSGFLITSLLVVERERNGRVALGQFWLRRARRLLPAMFSVVLAGTVVARLTMRPEELRRFGGEALSALAYVSNWTAIGRETDYWALFDSPSPLEHLWSLAIEEQFYVVWPLVVAGAVALGRGSRKVLAAVVGLGALASIVALWVHGAGAESTARAYYGTDTRAMSILFGAIVALVTAGHLRDERRTGERIVALAALGAAATLAVLWVVTGGTDPFLYRWGLPLHGMASALVIAGVSGPRSGRLGRVLSWRPFVAAGVVSYGLYLWHWPAYVVLDEARTGLEGWALTGVRIPVSVALAVVSYRAIEQPIRTGRVAVPRPFATVLVAGAAAALVVVALTGVDDPADATDLAEPRLAEGGAGDGDDEDGTTTVQARARVLVVGDSGAATMAEPLARAAQDADVEVRNEGQTGCGLPRRGEGVRAGDGAFFPDPEDCHQWPERWADAVEEFRPDAAVLLLSWNGIGDRDLGDGVGRGPCDEQFDDYYREEVARAAEVLGADGATVLLASVPPHGFDRSGDDSTDCLNDIYESVAEADSSVELLRLDSFVCMQGGCSGAADQLRPDGIHFAGEGARLAADWLVDETLRITGLADVPFVVVIGDSQAFRLVEHSPPRDELGYRVGGLALLGCGLGGHDVVVRGQDTGKDACREFAASVPDELEELRPDHVLVHLGVWDALDPIVDGARVAFPGEAWETQVASDVRIGLQRVAGDHEVLLLTLPCPAPGPGLDAFDAPDLPERIQALNRIATEAAGDLDVRVVDYGEHLCPGGVVRTSIEGVELRPDGLHLEEAGVRLVWDWLAPQLGTPGGPERAQPPG
jgi:peptidoglycan/LPS O-acetylase OafA/YrhL/lysophospholipase L1-like esterase